MRAPIVDVSACSSFFTSALRLSTAASFTCWGSSFAISAECLPSQHQHSQNSISTSMKISHVVNWVTVIAILLQLRTIQPILKTGVYPLEVTGRLNFVLRYFARKYVVTKAEIDAVICTAHRF